MYVGGGHLLEHDNLLGATYYGTHPLRKLILPSQWPSNDSSSSPPPFMWGLLAGLIDYRSVYVAAATVSSCVLQPYLEKFLSFSAASYS